MSSGTFGFGASDDEDDDFDLSTPAQPREGKREKAQRRKREFKSGARNEEWREKRHNEIGGIRKERRLSHLRAKRRHCAESQKETRILDRDELLDLCQALETSHEADEPQETLRLLGELRAFLSSEQEWPVEDVHEMHVLPVLLDVVANSGHNTKLQEAATWCLVNISAGSDDDSRAVVEVAPYLIEFLQGPVDELHEPALWCLGNIAYGVISEREALVNNGMLELLGVLVERHSQHNMLKTVCWATCNMLTGSQTSVDAFWELGVGPVLLELLLADDDYVNEDLKHEVAHVLTYLTAGRENTEKLLSLLENDLLDAVRTQMAKMNAELLFPIVRLVANVTSLDDDVVDQLFDQIPDLMTQLKALVTVELHPALVRELCFVLSNLTAGSSDHIQAVVDADVMPTMCSLLHTSGLDVRTEAAYVLVNLSSFNAELLVDSATKHDALTGVSSLLASHHTEGIQLALTYLEMLLREMGREGVLLVEESPAYLAFESLVFSEHQDSTVVQRCERIMEKYFEDE